MSSSASVKLRYEKCLQVWGNAIRNKLKAYEIGFLSVRTAPLTAKPVAGHSKTTGAFKLQTACALHVPKINKESRNSIFDLSCNRHVSPSLDGLVDAYWLILNRPPSTVNRPQFTALTTFV